MEVTGALVQHPQLQQVALAQRIVLDRLERDHDPVGRLLEATHHLARGAPDEVGVPKRGGIGEARRIDPVGILEVGADVGVGVVHGGGGGDAGYLGDLLRLLDADRHDVLDEQRLAVGHHELGRDRRFGETPADHREGADRVGQDFAVVREAVGDRGGAHLGPGRRSVPHPCTARW